MPKTLDNLVKGALSLPARKRLTLAHELLKSVEEQPSAEVDAAWDREIQERIRRHDAGESKAIPAGEVFKELDRRLKR